VRSAYVNPLGTPGDAVEGILGGDAAHQPHLRGEGAQVDVKNLGREGRVSVSAG
jgi:hypothetical protein